MELSKELDEKGLYGVKTITKSDLIKSTNENNTGYQAKRQVIYEATSLNKQMILKLDFTTNNTFFLMTNGEVYSKGKGNALGRKETENKIDEVLFFAKSPLLKKTSIKPIIYDISCGDDHILALDSNNNVWGWGDNSYRQIIPRNDASEFLEPVMIDVSLATSQINKIAAIGNSSFCVSVKNRIISWGEFNLKGNGGTQGNEKEEMFGEFMRYDDISKIIDDFMLKDTSDYTDMFMGARKMVNPKYIYRSKDSDQKKLLIDNLNIKLRRLKKEYEEKQKANKISQNALMTLSSDTNIGSLQELIKILEVKLNKISSKKEQLRKEYTVIDDEITAEKADVQNNKKLIEEIETEIEKLYNQITKMELHSKGVYQQTNVSSVKPKEKKFTIISSIMPENPELIELQKRIHNKEIFKDSLNRNLQVMIASIDKKEKELSLLFTEINKITDKENNALKSRNTIEDMITVLYESNLKNSPDKVDKKQIGKTNKIFDTYNEMIKLNDQCDECAFLVLNSKFPNKNTNEILNDSNLAVFKIKKGLKKVTANEAENVKNELRIVHELLSTKISLTVEQNKMIRIIYILLASIDPKNVKEYFLDKNNKTESRTGGSEDKEVIYKQVIVNLIKDTFWMAHEESKLVQLTREDDNKASVNNEDLAKEAKMKKLNQLHIDNQNANIMKNSDIYDDIITYSYKDEVNDETPTTPGESESTWSWGTPTIK